MRLILKQWFSIKVQTQSCYTFLWRIQIIVNALCHQMCCPRYIRGHLELKKLYLLGLEIKFDSPKDQFWGLLAKIGPSDVVWSEILIYEGIFMNYAIVKVAQTTFTELQKLYFKVWKSIKNINLNNFSLNLLFYGCFAWKNCLWTHFMIYTVKDFAQGCIRSNEELLKLHFQNLKTTFGP